MKKCIIFLAGCALLLAGCRPISGSSDTQKKTYNVTFSADLKDGKLTAQKDGVNFEGGAVSEGTVITFTATPKTGYKVAKWEGVDQSSSDPHTAALTVTKDAHVTVTFAAATKYKVTFNQPSTGGTLKAHIKGGGEYTSGTEIDEQRTIIFTAEPETNYYVEKWEGTELLKNGNTAELVVKKTATVTVTFREYEIENPNWFATGTVYDISGNPHKVRLVISDGNLLTIFEGAQSWLANIWYESNKKTIHVGKGTITFDSTSVTFPADWKITLTGVEVNGFKLKNQTVTVNVTRSNL